MSRRFHKFQTFGVMAFAMTLSLFFCIARAWSSPPAGDAQPPAGQYGSQTSVAEPLATVERATPVVRSGDEISSIPKKFQYAFRLNLRGVYDDNIFLINGQHVGDYYLAIEPGLTLGYGDIVGPERNYIQFDYAPSFFFYADHSDENAIQHVMRLTGAYHVGHLNLSLGQDIQLLQGTNPQNASGGTGNSSPGINLDTGSRSDENVYTTNANFSYDLTGKTFLSGALHYDRYDYPNLIGSQTISGNIFFNYNYSPKLVIGLGGTGGYNLPEGGNPNESFEQINGNISYEATGKVNLHASFGIEFRQFAGSSSGSYVSPVYELDASYHPFDGTSITLTGSLHTQNSAVLFGQDYSLTDINLSIRQRLLRRFYLGMAVGYEHSNYFSTSTGADTSRTDNYYFFQPGIDVTITRYWTAGFYYLHRQDESSFDAFSFSDNQYGIRTSLTF